MIQKLTLLGGGGFVIRPNEKNQLFGAREITQKRKNVFSLFV